MALVIVLIIIGIIDRGFNVVAVIELDDSSHQGKEARDADRGRYSSDSISLYARFILNSSRY